MDKTVVLNALDSHFKDFEDALQNHSAINQGNITKILTRNIIDFKKKRIGSADPGDLFKRKYMDILVFR